MSRHYGEKSYEKDYEKGEIKKGVKIFDILAKKKDIDKDEVCSRKLRIKVPYETSRLFRKNHIAVGLMMFSIIYYDNGISVDKFDIKTKVGFMGITKDKYDIKMVSDEKTLQRCEQQINAEINKYKHMYK